MGEIKLSEAELEQAPVCDTCEDYVDDCKVVLIGSEWVHVSTGEVRCPGQEDDDTDDVAVPRTSPDRGEPLEVRRYVIGYDGDGYAIHGRPVTKANYYGTAPAEHNLTLAASSLEGRDVHPE